MGNSQQLKVPIFHMDCKSFFNIVRTRTYCPKCSWKIKGRERRKKTGKYSLFFLRVPNTWHWLCYQNVSIQPFNGQHQARMYPLVATIWRNLTKQTLQTFLKPQVFGKVNYKLVQNDPLLSLIITIQISLKTYFILIFLM